MLKMGIQLFDKHRPGEATLNTLGRCPSYGMNSLDELRHKQQAHIHKAHAAAETETLVL